MPYTDSELQFVIDRNAKIARDDPDARWGNSTSRATADTIVILGEEVQRLRARVKKLEEEELYANTGIKPRGGD